MLKVLLLIFALLTFSLNVALTYYLIRDKKNGPITHSLNKEVVSFDLSYNTVNEEATTTNVSETEVMVSDIKLE